MISHTDVVANLQHQLNGFAIDTNQSSHRADVVETRRLEQRWTADSPTDVKMTMRFRTQTERNLQRELAALVVATLSMCSAAWGASPQDASANSAHELAVWVPMQLNFVYRHVSTEYSCDGLAARMKSLLLKLGARPDLDVRGYGCTQLSGPDPLAGVKIRMNVLEVAGARPGLGAHWKRVDLLADRNIMEAASDCELIEQVAQKILPLFTVRNVDYSATCQARNPLPGSTRLKADVLIADQHPPPASAAR